MVFFNCDKCGESLKKNQVEKHHYRCHSYAYSCIDCQTVFDIQSYSGHLKCITENQKYGGKNYVEKTNKGEAKQNAWIDQVEGAIEAVKDPNLKQLLQRISGFANIPRKEAKFVNFLTNSIKIRDKGLCQRAWNAIAEEAKKIREEEEAAKKKLEEASTNGNDKAVMNGCEKAKTNGDFHEATEEDGKTPNGEATAVDFKWKKAIKRKLKEAGGEMKLKKLRRVVHDAFIEAGGDDGSDFVDIFEQKLAKAGVSVDGKVVSLAA